MTKDLMLVPRNFNKRDKNVYKWFPLSNVKCRNNDHYYRLCIKFVSPFNSYGNSMLFHFTSKKNLRGIVILYFTVSQ